MCDKLYLKQGYCNPRIDKCLKEIIEEINKESNLKTLASCCGHGKYHQTIVMSIKNHKGKFRPDQYAYEENTKLIICRKTRFYIYDADGLCYIPEVEKELKV